MSDVIYFKLAIAILGFCGFFVAQYIYKHKKKRTTPLICPMKFNCNNVIHSNYAKFLGISLEVYGIIYYILIAIIYFYLSFYTILSIPFIISLVLLSFFAFIFSLYLIFIQIFVLKEGCFWCFVSAFISIIIFILTFFIYDFNYIIQILIS